jgi:hypothetical protein
LPPRFEAIEHNVQFEDRGTEDNRFLVIENAELCQSKIGNVDYYRILAL